MKLSARESEILSFIQLSIQVLGHAPTQREIARRLGLNSRKTINGALCRLETKGMIRRETYKVRGISVLKQQVAA